MTPDPILISVVARVAAMPKGPRRLPVAPKSMWSRGQRFAVWFWGELFVQSHTRRWRGHEFRSRRLTRFLYRRHIDAKPRILA